MDKRKITYLIIFILIMMISTNAFPSLNHYTFNFSKDNLNFEKINTYDLISYGKLGFTDEIGKPQLPQKVILINIPVDKEIKSIKIVQKESEILKGEYNVYPAQPPQILSKDASEIKFIEADKSVYKAAGIYPIEIVERGKRGYLSGYNLASLIITPLQYKPSSKKLIFHKMIEISIAYRKNTSLALSFSQRSNHANNILQETIKRSVLNPEDVKIILPQRDLSFTKLPNEEHLYVIITSDELEQSFTPLVEWKYKKGLSAKTVSTSWIYSQYSGVDEAEQIRKFIKDAYQNWGTIWILLGGDANQVPIRKAFAFDCEYGSYDYNYIPCDLYFADLEGDWNANGNDIYGEISDNIDMYPDIFVGRAPVDDNAQATAFVNKILTYEKNPAVDNILNMLFLAMVLWWDPYTDSGVSKNYIEDAFVPQSFQPITKLYQSLGNENYTNVMNALNDGQNIINHDGHAWYNVMGIGNDHLYNSDMDILTNGPAYSILYSIGCWPAAFDYNCIAEHFITNPDGGGVAFVGNSRYGWGSPGNPKYGYSDRFDQSFYDYLFQHSLFNIGNTLNATKTKYIPLSRERNVYRWCEYELNLLGDPEMPIWTETPESLMVSYPNEIPIGQSSCTIIVTDGVDPVPNARICLKQNDEFYATAFTDISGSVNINIDITNPASDIELTVTQYNYLPFEGSISLISDSPYLTIDSCITNISPDKYIIPGETNNLSINVQNYGNQSTDNIEAELRTDNLNITLIDSFESIGYLGADSSLFFDNAFSFEVSGDMNNGEVAYLNYTLSDNNKDLWEGTIGITAIKPIISYIYQQISDSAQGNGNLNAEPGETVNPHVIIKNVGLKEAYNVQATLDTDNPYIDIPYCSWNFGDVDPENLTDNFLEISIDNDCPVPSFPELYINFSTDSGFTFIDSFFITVGETGFYDDMEDDTTQWSHWGTEDLWHLSNYRKFSGDYSWYCGYQGTQVYANDLEEFLQVDSIIIGQNTHLSFWCWYEFPNYGTDGFYVEIDAGSGWEEFDFIGSGGALGTLTTGNDWLEYDYDISEYEAGTEIDLRFKMVSDQAEVVEGVYIDNVKVYEKNDFITSDFISDVNYGVKPLQVQFFDRSHTQGSEITTWLWEFGDGETSTEENPIHTYYESGKKSVKLTVTDEFGMHAIKVKEDFIDVSSGGGNVIYVNQDSTGDYTNIKDAIGAIYDGDTLLIADGVYSGFLNKNMNLEGKNITIRSENDRQDCIIDGENLGFAFDLGINDSTCIKGISFKNFFNLFNGGAIICEYSSASIEDCSFDSCFSYESGGAVFAFMKEKISISDCEFTNCSASHGGAIYAQDYENIELVNNYFANDSADVGGGIYLASPGNTIIENCTLSYCSSSQKGGGVYLYNEDVDTIFVNGCDFSQNIAEKGGGIYTNSCSDLSFIDLNFENNGVSNYGGGLYINESGFEIVNSKIKNNSGVRGGGVYFASSDGSLVNCLIILNNVNGATAIGGALYSDNATFDINNCTIANNSADLYAGGLFAFNGEIDIKNSIFWDDDPQEIYPPNAPVNATFSDLKDSLPGTGNISENPLFADTAYFDYHLVEMSPCVDVGSNNYVVTYTDLDGNLRIWDGDDSGEAIVDMGCYEYDAPPVDIDDEETIVRDVILHQNYPNPFIYSTKINFQLCQKKNVNLAIYNIRGQRVKKLAEQKFNKGIYSFQWDGRDEYDNLVSSGIYFYKLSTYDYKASKGNINKKVYLKKMLLVR